MNHGKPVFLTFFILVMIICGYGIVSSATQSSILKSTSEQILNYQQDNKALTFNSSAWHYDADNDIYWQIEDVYCSNPETTDYENMAIYVPGEYMESTPNGDGTYTCKPDVKGEVNGYTSTTAPIVFPMNTAGYSAQAPATSYSFNGISNYTKSGFIYVYPGLRGRNNGYDSNGSLIYSGGAPWGVTDLKAAVRYYRFNQNLLPGDTDRIFVFGMSGGGAQTAVMGASGDSSLYYPYLKSIGAAMVDSNGNYISDAIFGAMCWCPITSLDLADEAYEWNMGQFASTDTRANSTWRSALSADLAEAFASYINNLSLSDTNGKVLILEKSTDGIYTSGTYNDYILSIIEGSLNNFLQDTTFPYTKSSGGFMADGGFGGGAPSGIPSGENPQAEGNQPPGDMPSGGAPGGNMNSQEGQSAVTYNTTQDYIDSLNSDEEWVIYDPETNTAKITSIEAFIRNCKTASKSVPAFDDVNRTQAENYVFGNDENDALHFDEIVTDLLQSNQGVYSTYSDWNASYVDAYQSDLKALDKFGNGIDYRQDMYNPMYYLCSAYEGYQKSNPAPYWRIRTGIDQGDTATTVESNLALVASEYPGVKGVDFETVWGLGHTTAERTGSSTNNFIDWINECVKKE